MAPVSAMAAAFDQHAGDMSCTCTDNRTTTAYHINKRHPCNSFSERGCKGVLSTLILLPLPGFFCVCLPARCLPFQGSEPNRAPRRHVPCATCHERVRAARPMCRLVPSCHCHPTYRHDRRECECVGPYAECCPNCTVDGESLVSIRAVNLPDP